MSHIKRRGIASIIAAVGLTISMVVPASASHGEYVEWGGGMTNGEMGSVITVCFKYWPDFASNLLWNNGQSIVNELNNKIGNDQINENIDFVNNDFQPGCVGDSINDIEIVWTPDGGGAPGSPCPASFPQSTVFAYTEPYNGNANVIRLNRECVDTFGTSFFDWSAGGDPDQGKMHLASIIEHEVGHALRHDHTHETVHGNLMDNGNPNGSNFNSLNCATSVSGFSGMVPFWGRKVYSVDRDFVRGLLDFYTGDTINNSLAYDVHLQCKRYDGQVNPY